MIHPDHSTMSYTLRNGAISPLLGGMPVTQNSLERGDTRNAVDSHEMYNDELWVLSDQRTDDTSSRPRKRGKTASLISMLASMREPVVEETALSREYDVRSSKNSSSMEITMISGIVENVDSCTVSSGNNYDLLEAFFTRESSTDCSDSLNEGSNNYHSSIANVTTTGSIASDDDFASFFQDDEEDDFIVDTGHSFGLLLGLSSRAKSKTNRIESDFLSSLPQDLLYRITSFLDAKSLLLSFGCVNRSLNTLCRDDAAGWENLCHNTWRTKCHVSPSVLDDLKNTDSMTDPQVSSTSSKKYYEAYRRAWHDAKTRDFITENELCYDSKSGTGTVWSFRFKKSAGNDWTSADPWFSGLPCRKLVFLKDGSIKEAVRIRSDSPVATVFTESQNHIQREQSNQQNAPLRSVTNFVHFNQDAINMLQLSNQMVNQNYRRDQWSLIDPPTTMTWRFLSRPMDLPRRTQPGSYIRITTGGRDVPTYSVTRSKNGNWGFVMESCWGIWASFELPSQKIPRSLHPTTELSISGSRKRRNNHLVLRRRPLQMEGAMWVRVDDEREYDSALQEVCASPLHISHDSYLQDDSLLLSNEVQWREAFLYNVGARVLPDGDEATEAFDQAWGGMYARSTGSFR